MPRALTHHIESHAHFTFADIAFELLECYAKSIEPWHIQDNDALSKRYFNLSKAYNELTQFDYILMRVIHGEASEALVYNYRKEVTKPLRALRKDFSRYITAHSPLILARVLIKLETLEQKLRQLDKTVDGQQAISDFDELYDEVLIQCLLEAI